MSLLCFSIDDNDLRVTPNATVRSNVVFYFGEVYMNITSCTYWKDATSNCTLPYVCVHTCVV